MEEKNSAYGSDAEIKSVQTADSNETRLKALAEQLSKKNRESKASSARMEKLSENIENERARRVEDTVAKMSKNSERAEKSADERSAMLEYGAEYKLRLMAKKEKEAAKMARQLRERERSAFAVNPPSAVENSASCQSFFENGGISQENTVSLEAEDLKTDIAVLEESTVEIADSELAFEQKNVGYIENEEPKDERADFDTADESNHQAVELDAAEPIRVEADEPFDEDEFRIEIGAMGKNYATVAIKNEPTYDDVILLNIDGAAFNVPAVKEEISRKNSMSHEHSELSYEHEKHAAELKHRARVCAAIQAANGAAREEIRLLREEQERYEAEISEIKKMRREYNCVIESDADTVTVDAEPHVNYEFSDDFKIEIGEAPYWRVPESDFVAANDFASSEKESDFAVAYDFNSGKKVPDFDVAYGLAANDEPSVLARKGTEHTSLSDASQMQELERYERYRMSTEPRNIPSLQTEEPCGDVLAAEPQYGTEVYIHEPNYDAHVADNSQRYQGIEEYDEIHEFYRSERIYPEHSVIYRDEREDYHKRSAEDSELELLNARERADIIKKSGRRVAKIDDFDLDEAYEHHEREEKNIHSYHEHGVHLFTRSELSAALSGYAKDERLAEKRIQKINSRAKGATIEESTVLAVERIAVQKELCEIAIEALSACVSAEMNGKIAKYRRKLALRINEYNGACEEYETLTARPLHRIDGEIINDVLEGRMCEPIPAVYYFSEDEDKRTIAAEQRNAAEYRRGEEERLISEEYQRFVDDPPRPEYSKEEAKSRIKKQSHRISAIKRAAERDMLLFALRGEKRAESLIEERDLILNSFGQEKRKTVKRVREIEEKLHKQNAEEKSAAAIERATNTRYYLLAALEPENEKIKPGARRERLDAMRARLNILLAERESINERLIALYGGSDRKLIFSKISKKAASVRRKAAKSAYKKQKHYAKKIELSKASDSAKEEAYEILNKIIAAKAKAAEYRYKLRKLRPNAKARRELVSELRKAEAQARLSEKEIRYAIKRFKYDQMRKEANREWFKLLAIVAALAVVGVGIWYFLGDKIVDYFMDIKRKLGG